MITHWTDAINKLRSLGYDISLSGEELRYAYKGKVDERSPNSLELLKILKTHKEEILHNPDFLVKQTLKEINTGWIPGTLEWLRVNRPEEYKRMLNLEGEINKTTQEGNIEGLRDALEKYKELFLSIVKEFRETKRIKKEPYYIYSDLLQACLWIVPIENDIKTLREEGITEPIYTADEIGHLKGVDKEMLKVVHMVKTVFPGSKTIH